MKIAITGHTAGIGQALAIQLQQRGHEIIGLSKRHGDNIRNIAKISAKIVPCDVFVNNAQDGYAQTELLYEIWQAWRDQPNKHIWCIGTGLTQLPVDVEIPGLSDVTVSQYRNQKTALNQAIEQLSFKANWPIVTMIRPGGVATQPDQTSPWPYCDVDAWAKVIIEAMIMANDSNMRFNELTLLPAKTKLDL